MMVKSEMNSPYSTYHFLVLYLIFELSQLLDSSMRIMEVEDQLNPTRILGLRASTSLVTSMFTLAGSVVTIGLRYFRS